MNVLDDDDDDDELLLKVHQYFVENYDAFVPILFLGGVNINKCM